MKGLGYEEDTSYSSTHFMGIENIHVMRDALVKLFELLNKDNQ